MAHVTSCGVHTCVLVIMPMSLAGETDPHRFQQCRVIRIPDDHFHCQAMLRGARLLEAIVARPDCPKPLWRCKLPILGGGSGDLADEDRGGANPAACRR